MPMVNILPKFTLLDSMFTRNILTDRDLHDVTALAHAVLIIMTTSQQILQGILQLLFFTHTEETDD